MLARAPLKVRLALWYAFMALSTLVFALLLFCAWENAAHQSWWLRLAYIGLYVGGWVIWLRQKPREPHLIS